MPNVGAPGAAARARALLLGHLPLVLLAAVFLAFGLLAPRFLAWGNLENVVKQASYVGVVAAGVTLVLLTGGIDLSVGSNMYVSAAVAGLLMARGAGVAPAVLAALSVGLLFGALHAVAVARLGVLPFVATLATLVAGRGVGLALTGSRAVPFPDEVLRLGSARVLGLVPAPIAVFALVVLLAHLFLERTRLGRQVYAVGHDREAARRAGVPVGRVLAAAYLLCGLLAALGGVVSVAQLGTLNAGFGEGDEFDAIAAAVLGGASLFGGRGRVFPGTVLGAVLVQTVVTGLVFTQVDLYLQPLVVAGVIFAAVLMDGARTRQAARRARRAIRAEPAA